MNEPISILILDFKKPQESEILLKSIKDFCKFDHRVVFLDNGSSETYSLEFKEKGLVDELIINEKNVGAGFGQVQLIELCKSDYFFFVQVDQFLINEINENHIKWFMDLLENQEYNLIDLAGDQSNKGIYSDRGHFGKTDFFRKMELNKNAGGGPGPFQSSLRWNENYIQQLFKDNNYKIAHISPLFFADNGKVSIREINGGKLMHYTDEKTLFVLEIPKEKDNWYELTNEEWEEIFSGNWPPEGKIPKNYIKNSFKYW